MPTEILRPDSNVTQTLMTGGYAETDEVAADDADFAYPNADGANVLEVGLSNPANTALTTLTTTIRYRIRRVSTSGGTSPPAGSLSATLHLYQGATLIESDTTRSITGNTAQAFSWTPTMTSVTDFTDLRLRMTQTAASSRGIGLTWAEVEVPYAAALALASGSFTLTGGTLSYFIATFIALAGGAFTLAGGALSLVEKTFRFGARRSANRSDVRRKSFSSKER
jgi:hypothetical protein